MKCICLVDINPSCNHFFNLPVAASAIALLPPAIILAPLRGAKIRSPAAHLLPNKFQFIEHISQTLGHVCPEVWKSFALKAIRHRSTGLQPRKLRFIGLCPEKSRRLCPEPFGIHHAALIHVASAEQYRIPVPDFTLQLGERAKVAQVIAREGVAQRIRAPSVVSFPPRLLSQKSPMFQPIGWADEGIDDALFCSEHVQQRRMYAYSASPTGLAVPGLDVYGTVAQINLVPCEAGHFVRPDAGIEHHADSGQAISPSCFRAAFMMFVISSGVRIGSLPS